MRFALSAEQTQLRDSLRKFLADKSPTDRVRQVVQTGDGYDSTLWSQLTDQLGLQAITIPELYPNAGVGYVELAVVLEEMGRALLPSPYLATVALAANAILTSGDRSAMRELLPPIADGKCTATLAWTEDTNGWGLDGITTRARWTGTGWVVTGQKNAVLDGHLADLVLVVAATDSGLSLFAVDGKDDRLTRRRLTTMDPTRPLARLELDACPARLIGDAGQAGPGLRKTLDLAAVALAAEQAGGARRCLEMAVDYAKTREQFGKPIGSFQAVKHKCADVLVEVESAWAAAYYAAWAAAEGSDELPAAAAIAKSYCSSAYAHAAAENVQIHGGIGFTWEHDAQLYLKRAKSSELLFGEPARHRARLAELAGL